MDWWFRTKKTCRVPKIYFENGERPPEKHSWEELSADDLPKNWDWGNINGTNYLSWNKNQHIPVYCGSCWAQGTTSSIADRFNIMYKDLNPTPVGLNAQVIVNCRAGGSCEGGNPGGVYEYAKKTGIPDSSCEQYVAKDGSCSAKTRCKDCTWPPCPVGQTCQDKCWAVPHMNYLVKNYYSFSGADKMKAEIYKNGPISCGIDATDKFEAYKGGIYSEKKTFAMINHEIALVGWGVDEKSGQEFWWLRNSWGTYWGENGFAQVLMHKNNLGVETDCSAGIPDKREPVNPTTQEFDLIQ